MCICAKYIYACDTDDASTTHTHSHTQIPHKLSTFLFMRRCASERIPLIAETFTPNAVKGAAAADVVIFWGTHTHARCPNTHENNGERNAQVRAMPSSLRCAFMSTNTREEKDSKKKIRFGLQRRHTHTRRYFDKSVWRRRRAY